MCNSDDSAVVELTLDGFLNEVICFQVHSSCGLIKDKDLLRLQKWGVAAASPDQKQMSTLQCVSHSIICVGVKEVKIHPQGTREQHWVLQEKAKPGQQLVVRKLTNYMLIVYNIPGV